MHALCLVQYYSECIRQFQYTPCIFDFYLLRVDMNTSILLVESQVILNRITGFKSKNILKWAFQDKKRARPSAHNAFGARVYQSRSHRFILKRVIRFHITCLITEIRKILIKHITWLPCSTNVINLLLKSCLFNF